MKLERNTEGQNGPWMDKTEEDKNGLRLVKFKNLLLSFQVYLNGPFVAGSHVVQRHLAGEQETHWDKTNKELTSS